MWIRLCFRTVITKKSLKGLPTALQVPIYIILSFEYAVLTLRFWRMLDKVC